MQYNSEEYDISLTILQKKLKWIPNENMDEHLYWTRSGYRVDLSRI